MIRRPPTSTQSRSSAASDVYKRQQEDYSDWAEIKGFQLQGEVQRVPSAKLSECISAYSEKFPVTGAGAPTEIAQALERIHWFELTVQKVYFINNSLGLGHRDELVPERLFSF